MNEVPALRKRINQFVIDELGVTSKQVLGNPSLFHELNIDGDDGTEFMIAFAKEFNVDIGGFEPSLHFGPEAAATPWSILKWLLFPARRAKFIPIYLDDLADAANKGVWLTPRHAAA